MNSRVFGRRAARPVSELSVPERLNFLVTNRLPRRWLTLAFGRFSKIRFPPVRWLSIATWQLFVDDLRLFEARKGHFESLHDCFTRELKAGARPIDRDTEVLSSPCDAVIGEFGQVNGFSAIQAKGFPYAIDDLLGNGDTAKRYRDGRFITLRLKSSMYHRFHAPCDARLKEITYISGDTWNVNPIALKTVERLFCKNERAVLNLEPESSGAVTLVAVAAILVASMRIHGLAYPLDLRYKGANRIPCQRTLRKGDEIGFFEHGSTIIVFATPEFCFSDSLAIGETIRMGQPLMTRLR